MLKKIIYANILATLVLTTGQANAQRYDIITKISRIRYHTSDNITGTSWQSSSWISLQSPGDLINSTCGKSGTEYLIAIGPNDKDALAVALSAKGINADVQITVDDTEKFVGTCKLQYITIN